MNKDKRKKQEQRIKKEELELRKNKKELSELKKSGKKKTKSKTKGKSSKKNWWFPFFVLMNTTGFTCGSKKLIAMSRKK